MALLALAADPVAAAAAVARAAVPGVSSPSVPASPLAVTAHLRFDFHSGFLMNLHHFLYDAARHPDRLGVAWSARPSDDDMATMRAAVAFYARNYAARDLLFDDEMVDIKHALAVDDDQRRDARGLALPPELIVQMERVAPVYARTLWPSHDATNLAWIARVRALEARYGAAIQPAIEKALDHPFPAGIRDDVVVDTGTFTGAYTDGPPPQTVIPSGWREYDGLAALEMIWHEAAHADVTDTLEHAIAADVDTLHRAPASARNLWHAAQFYAVGHVVQDVLARDGHVDYVPYATRNGVCARAWQSFVPLLQGDWEAWLQGRGSMGEAVRAMVAQLPPA